MACRVLTDDYTCIKLFMIIPETNLNKNILSDGNIFTFISPEYRLSTEAENQTFFYKNIILILIHTKGTNSFLLTNQHKIYE